MLEFLNLRNSTSQTAPEPAYKLMDLASDMKMEKNPAYSVAAVRESSADHNYEAIFLLIIVILKLKINCAL